MLLIDNSIFFYKYYMRNLINVVEALNHGSSDLPFDEATAVARIIQKIKIYEPETDDIQKQAENTLQATYDAIMALFDGGSSIKIYREIEAPRDWQPDDYGRYGIYWTWDKHSAYAYNGRRDANHIKWLLTAEVHQDQIDWLSTIAANASLGTRLEREITLDERAYVDLISVEQVD